MSGKKYVGMDVHAATTVVAVRDGRGHLVSQSTLKTEAGVLRDYVRGLSGEVHVTFEEGAQADWLFDLLEPLAHRVLVCNPRENRSGASRTKNDRIDADRLSEWLYKGVLKAVYHGERSTRELEAAVRTYQCLISDQTRTKNRLKAIFRSRAIPASGERPYHPAYRQLYLSKLEQPGLRERARMLGAQLDALRPLLAEAKRALRRLARAHPAYTSLASIPGLGPVRVAAVIAAMKTPHRFRRNRQLWAYAGLAIDTSASSEQEFVDGQLRRRKGAVLTRGLNMNHNRRLKEVLKGAAEAASRKQLKELYTAIVAKGTRPQLAKLTIARKIATLVLTLWRKGECFDATKLTRAV
jgi:transposase